MSSTQHPSDQAPSSHSGDASHPAPPSISRRGVGIFLVVALLLAVILAIGGILPRIHAAKELATETNRLAIPDVSIIQPVQNKPTQEIVLPGNMQAYIDAPIYARTNGYLKAWYHDIGSRVKKGELLAVIESPEVDQQLAQAKEDLATAQANLAIAQTTARRYQDLLKTNSVSRQDTDNFVAEAAARQTTVNSEQANVKRLEELQGFERVVAPFDGIITARGTDVGQLINAGSAGGPTPNSRELFHIAAINPLRVFVNVPQIYSRDATPSAVASLTLPQFPGRSFPGKLVRSSNAIDPNSRTLLVEVDVENKSGELLPGSYTEVHLKVHSQVPTVLLPVSALIFRSEGLRVATLGPNNRAHLVSIITGRDFGRSIEVVSGIAPDQKIIDSPPDSLVENEEVHPIASSSKPGGSS